MPNERHDPRLRSAKPSEKFLREQQLRHQLRCEACRDYSRRREGLTRSRRKAEAGFFAAQNLTVSFHGDRLTYLDCNGRVHVEEELSAEELIRQWKESHAE